MKPHATTTCAQQGVEHEEIRLEDTRRLWKSLRNGDLVPETKRPPNAAASP